MKHFARFGSLLLVAALAFPWLQAQQARSGPWVMESSGTTAGLRGIHSVGNGSVAWASGTNGTILRTEDAGYLWQRCAVPPNAAKLDFRGIWAWDENTAIVMSSGPGDQSRIYKTTDGCAHWKLLFTNPDKLGFWDAMVFSGKEHGALLGDPLDGSFALFETFDQGEHWTRDTSGGLRASLKESAFAASNSCLVAYALGTGWLFATGGSGGSRIFESQNLISESGLSRNWYAVGVPAVPQGTASGIFSLAFRDADHGIAVGGDYTKPNDSTGTAAWTSDAGHHWTAATKPPHGFRSAVTWDSAAKAWIAAGTNGSDVSYDNGRTWTPLDNGNWNALSLPYIVGPKGRIAKLDESKLPKR